MEKDNILEILRKDRNLSKYNPLVNALYLLALGDWEEAHKIAMSKEGTPDYDYLHAHLHRVKGDTFNANFWYKKANQELPKLSIDTEWVILYYLFTDN